MRKEPEGAGSVGSSTSSCATQEEASTVGLQQKRSSDGQWVVGEATKRLTEMDAFDVAGQAPY